MLTWNSQREEGVEEDTGSVPVRVSGSLLVVHKTSKIKPLNIHIKKSPEDFKELGYGVFYRSNRDPQWETELWENNLERQYTH